MKRSWTRETRDAQGLARRPALVPGELPMLVASATKNERRAMIGEAPMAGGRSGWPGDRPPCLLYSMDLTVLELAVREAPT